MNFSAFALASPQAEAADGRARAFIAARRHSRRVRMARRVLEVAVIGGVAALAGLAFLHNLGRALRDVSFDGVGIEGGRITMDRPRLTGVHPGGGGYNITAVKAMQDALHPGDVDLALIGGEISAPDREVSRLSANTGHYQSADETLDLAGDVRLKNSRYEIFLRSVHIKFKQGEYVSKEPVKVRILPDTTITGDSLLVKDNGAEATFAGHVRTLINGKDVALEGSTP
jgi:lipopolysaccharide export system protein LptC